MPTHKDIYSIRHNDVTHGTGAEIESTTIINLGEIMKQLNTVLIALAIASTSLPVLADAATEAASASATAAPPAAAENTNSRAAMRERFMQRIEQRRQQNGGSTGTRKMPGDTNGDGMISKQEAQSMPHLSSNFDAIDSNKDGQLSQEELRAFGQGMKGNMPMHNQAAAPASATATK